MEPALLAYDEKFYTEEGESSDRAASIVIPMVMDAMDIASVLDIGCGVGMFLRYFSERGVNDYLGVDGDYVPQDYKKIPPGNFRAHDLKTPLRLNRRYDLVMTLEVAEHLPDSAADDFVATLCAHGDVVLFSAAIPEQGGRNHINEQWPDYWAAKFAAHGYKGVDYLRPRLWDDRKVDYWYRQNLLFFANPEGLAKNPKLAQAAAETIGGKSLNLVHPEMYNAKLQMIRNAEKIIQVLQPVIDQIMRAKKAG